MIGQILHVAQQVLSVTADVFGVVFGAIALWGLVFRRRELKSMFLLLASSHLTHRTTVVRDTLNKIEALNYNQKEHRPELRALLGQLSGQVKALAHDYAPLAPIAERIQKVALGEERLTEGTKRSLSHELQGLLESANFKAQRKVIGGG